MPRYCLLLLQGGRGWGAGRSGRVLRGAAGVGRWRHLEVPGQAGCGMAGVSEHAAVGEERGYQGAWDSWHAGMD